MTAPIENPEKAARRATLRRATLQLVMGVVVLDAIAMAIFYFGGIEHGPEKTRTIFVIIWTFATALVVAFLLRRVRAARYVTRRPYR